MVIRIPAIDLIMPVNWQAPWNIGLESMCMVIPGNKSGSKWVDLTKRRTDGTLTGFDTAKAWKGTNRLGGFGAIEFDGSDDYVDLGDHGAAESGGGAFAYAYSVWIKTTQTGTDKWIVSEGSTTSGNPIVGIINQDGVARFYHRPTAGGQGLFGGNDGLLGSSVINDGEWHHIVGTVDSTVDARLYVDGILEDSDATVSTGATALNTTSVGALRRSSLGQFVTGQLDDARIWSRSISEEDVVGMYFDAIQGYPDTLNWIRVPSAIAAAVTTSPWYQYQQQLAGAI